MESVAKTPIKFRASCDGCFHAKLKCSKERPTCPRCKNLGLLCKYSPSQRSGKKASAQKGNAAQCSKQHDPTQTQYDNQSQSWEWPSELTSTLVFNSLSASAVQAGAMKPAFDPGSLEHTQNLNQTVGSQQQTTPMNAWPSGSDNVLRNLDESFLTPWRDYLPNSEDTSMTSPSMYKAPFDLSSTEQSSNTTMTPPPSRDETCFSTESALMTSPDDLAYLKSQDETSCTCFPSIISALHTMQSEAKNCCNPPLEMILSGSRMVTARGESLLACSCSSDSTLIMLFASLIAQHLTFYFPTPKTSIPSLPESLCPNSQPSDVARRNSLASYPSTNSTIKTPSPSCVTIGRYTMDPESSEHLRIKIMIMELQKLNAMLGKFRGKFSALPVGYEGHAYETVLNFLNTRTREGIERLAACEKEAEGSR